ncbi:ankyrin repeat domain-containing protein [Pseudomonas sp. C11]|uniref:ankyrin repeat domain-containing protein n=1 Tax=Pseudomonas sp. C11 TaxID=3075550 RepID=UPI002AFEDF86|nr:ankyrin repeat domain-containing protein [Pseudomonas sp. C11]
MIGAIVFFGMLTTLALGWALAAGFLYYFLRRKALLSNIVGCIGALFFAYLYINALPKSEQQLERERLAARSEDSAKMVGPEMLAELKTTDSPVCEVMGPGDLQVKLVTVVTEKGVVALNGSARARAESRGWIDGKTVYEPSELLRLTEEGLSRCDGAPAPEIAKRDDPLQQQDPQDLAAPMTVEALKKAVEAGNIAIVRQYIASGFDVNSKDKEVPAIGIPGSPAIDTAAAAGKCQVLDELLVAGAQADPKSIQFGFTPLSLAAQAGASACVKSLLAKKVRLDVRTEPGGDTALIMAAYGGHLEVVQMLVEKGANMQLKNKDGDTPLRAAEVFGNVSVANYLRSKGARE